jgi:hypothetical protein
MNSSYITVIVIMLMIAVMIGVDILFFRNLFWGRLAVNTGIVLIFIAFYLRLLRHL